jgi:hypothetical protein
MAANTQTRNGSATNARLDAMQEQIDTLAWLHHEQAQTVQRLTMAFAGLLTQQARPQLEQQIQQEIAARLTGALP